LTELKLEEGEVTETVGVSVKVSVLVNSVEEVKPVVTMPPLDELTETGIVVQGRSTVTVVVHPHLRELPPCLKLGL
jgi:hypothetical protein